MDSSQQQKQDNVDVMEVPAEIHGDLLMELLDASLAADAENAGHQQLGLLADVDGDCWIDSQENDDGIHAHQDCEDCGLDGGGILSDFDEYGSSRLMRFRSPAPYDVFDDTLEWAETADADAMDPFTSECCTGHWYMDGLVMAMEWEEQEQDAGSGGFPFEPCGYGSGEAAGAEQVYAIAASPLWE